MREKIRKKVTVFSTNYDEMLDKLYRNEEFIRNKLFQYFERFFFHKYNILIKFRKFV